MRMGLSECIAGRFARGCSLSEIVGIYEEFLRATLGAMRDKVMAGGTPANNATLVTNYIPSIVRARRAIEIATLVSGSSSCRPVRDSIRSIR